MASSFVTLYHAGFILGVPGEQAAGIYGVEGSEIVSFAPLPAEALGSPTGPVAEEQANQSADTGQAANVPAPEAPVGNTLG